MVADDDNMAWLQFYVDIGTSFFFTSFAGRDITDHLLQNNSNMYVFEFTYPSQIDGGYNNVVPDWHPVPHMAEIPYLFYEVNWEKELKAGKINQTDFDLTNFFGEAWTNFAKFGKPTMDNSWKPTTSSDPKMMEYFEIGANSGMRTGYRKHDQITFNQAVQPDGPNLL
uniref:Carboxylesterase type B domain-containing protein n=1 Tax=Acrobeloides nanus TaxID=290746 RepID=A0A914EE88_9BILA